jgi:serine/threonine-protein kinase
VLAGLLNEPSNDEELPYPQVGDYELIRKIGEGGMGVVYWARHVRDGTDAAIKFAKAEPFGCSAGRARFQNEIKLTCKLRHRNITRVFESGWHDGRQYYVMELLEETLEDPCNYEKYGSPSAAAELILKVARAVQYAHAQEVYHCDLKPANILFDGQGEPHVSDFGLALSAGTPSAKSVDVFQLGVLLHWLLKGGKPAERRPESAPPPVWAPTLEWALETICHRALQADTVLTYTSVAELAGELERAARGGTIRDENRPIRRAVRWIHRHRLISLLGVELALSLLCIPLMVSAMLVELRPPLRELIRFSAKAQAGSVVNELRDAFGAVERMAQDPAVQELVTLNDLKTPPDALTRHRGKFDNVFVFDRLGIFQARSTQPERFDARPDYAFRDYFRCAEQLSRVMDRSGSAVCIGRVYRSTTDRHLKLGISAPLHSADQRFIGVVQASIDARESFGGLQMKCGQGECVSALIGPRDRDASDVPLPKALAVLAHPSLKPPLVQPYQERRLAPGIVAEICRKLDCQPDPREPLALPRREPIVVDDFEDPVTHQKLVAALAPVGRTGLIVLVATPHSALDRIVESIGRAAGLLVGLALTLGLLAMGSVLSAPHVRRWYRLERGHRIRRSSNG